jgi:hypothetical protein
MGAEKTERSDEWRRRRLGTCLIRWTREGTSKRVREGEKLVIGRSDNDRQNLEVLIERRMLGKIRT